MDRAVDFLPSTVDAPFSEIVVDRFPRREVVRKQAPLATAPYHIEDGVEDFSQAIAPWSASSFQGRKMRLQTGPFCVGEVGGVRLSHAC